MSSSSPTETAEQAPTVGAVDPDREKPSLFRGKLRFWGTMVPLVALDLWSKAAVFAFLGATAPNVGAGRTYTVWGGPVHFSLVTYWNTGTIWGLFPDWNFPLTVLRCLALIVLAYFAARTARKDRLQLHILGLISAGAMGNLYDNLTQPKGGVRDFLLFFIVRDGGESSFPAFNVADSCITVGAFAMIIWLWRADIAQAKKGKADKRARHAG